MRGASWDYFLLRLPMSSRISLLRLTQLSRLRFSLRWVSSRSSFDRSTSMLLMMESDMPFASGAGSRFDTPTDDDKPSYADR